MYYTPFSFLCNLVHNVPVYHMYNISFLSSYMHDIHIHYIYCTLLLFSLFSSVFLVFLVPLFSFSTFYIYSYTLLLFHPDLCIPYPNILTVLLTICFLL